MRKQRTANKGTLILNPSPVMEKEEKRPASRGGTAKYSKDAKKGEGEVRGLRRGVMGLTAGNGRGRVFL
jgi:hypothetical protein